MDGADTAPADWLKVWAARYPDAKYGPEHDDLIAKRGELKAEDFELIGRWKDAARSAAKWRANVASVAFLIWMKAATELPKCPDEAAVVGFLTDWSARSYQDRFGPKVIEKVFGLSRATTLLYFASAGRFPIFDSRARRAVSRLRGKSIPKSVEGYITSYRPAFLEVATLCGTSDFRLVDRALFSYGGKDLPFPD